MNPTSNAWTRIVAVTLVAVALAGCSGSKADPAPSASSTPHLVASSSPAAPPPKAADKPLPGVAYNEHYPFQPNAALVAKSLNVTTAWSTLKITFWQNRTASCYVMSSDPPEGTSTGAAPKLTLVSPITKTKVEFTDLISSASCATGSAAGILATATKDVPNELGDWTIGVTGRGQNVDLAILVLGQ